MVGSLACMVLVTIGATLFLVLTTGSSTSALTETFEGPTFLGVTSIVQIVAMGGVALALTQLLRTTTPQALRPTLADAFGLRATSPIWYAVAALGGLTIWTFPSWLAVWLESWLPWESTVSIVSEALQGPLSTTWPLIVALVVSAPIVEECIFRGYLWTVLERGRGGVMALVGTTVLFTAYHADPVHVIALMPTAAFFGVLRWRSNSIGPPIVAHFANNSVGVVLGVLAASNEAPTSELTAIPAVAGLAFCGVITGVAWWWSARGSR